MYDRFLKNSKWLLKRSVLRRQNKCHLQELLKNTYRKSKILLLFSETIRNYVSIIIQSGTCIIIRHLTFYVLTFYSWILINIFKNDFKIIDERRNVIKLMENQICNKNSYFLSLGSMVTKLAANNNSDIDLAFITHDINFLNTFFKNEEFRIFFMDIMSGMISGLENIDKRLRVAEPIIALYHLFVPLIVAKFECGLAVDIQFPRYSLQAVRNTYLVKNYVLADERFAQLYFYVRSVFVALGLKNSREGLFSSYQIICLVIHFLHKKDSEPSVLPVLYETHSNLFNMNLPKNELVQNMISDKNLLNGWKSKNNKSVGELAVEFFDYYANYFDPISQSIHLASGSLKKRSIPKDNQLVRLSIIDPFSEQSICRSDLLIDVMRTLFPFVWRALSEEGQYLDSFPDFSNEALAFRTAFASKKWSSCNKKNFEADNTKKPLERLNVEF